MDVDAQYAALSTLAQSHKSRSLNELGRITPTKVDGFFKLGECCNLVLNDRSFGVVSAHNYLATLNEFVGRLTDPRIRQKVWSKIAGGNASAFLDEVVEAAWALHFWDAGFSPIFEKPFDASNPKSSGDADFVVTLADKEYWLDAFSVDLSQRYHVPTAKDPILFYPTYGREDLIFEFGHLAKAKYNAKFKGAVNRGLLKGSSSGVLLCVLKSEAVALSHFVGLPIPPPPPLPPEDLFNEESPGLDLVWIHTLRPKENSDLLEPLTIVKWMRT